MITDLAKDPVLTRSRAVLQKIHGNGIERIVLFGSRARGEVQPDSDYDPAVFFKDLPDRWRELEHDSSSRFRLGCII